MNLFFNWSDPADPSRRELIFEERNKSYGAYEIRRRYFGNIVVALCFSISCLLAIVVWPVISGYLSEVSDHRKKVTETISLEEPPPIDKNTPPPPPFAEPPPLRQTVKFTAPLIVENPDPDEVPPTQDEVKQVQVSTITQEGEDIAELPPDPADNQSDEVFTIVEEMPSFPGGDRKLLQMLSRIHYPRLARENGVSGSVFLSFIVDKDGSIKDAKVLKGIGAGCDEEALRVLMTLPPWNPGRQNGRPVPVRSSVRVNFALQ